MRIVRLLVIAMLPWGCATQAPAPAVSPVFTSAPASPQASASPSAAELGPSPSPVGPSPSPFGAASLAGPWAFGTGAEPAAGPVDECNALKGISLQGDVVSMRDQLPCGPSLESSEGRLVGGRLTLDGERLTPAGEVPVHYELTYDPVSDRLRGTRDGAPFWLARNRGGCAYSAALCPTAVIGRVYDADGGVLRGARVTIKSLNPSNPYEETFDAPDGDFASFHVPVGVRILVRAEKPGWLPVERSEIVATRELLRVNFGGPATKADPGAPAFPLLPVATPSPE